MTRVLVTGGAGFIGSHVVERLVAEGWHATVVDNLSTGDPRNLAGVLERIRLVEDDLVSALRSGAVDPADFDLVVHLAANPYVPWSVDNPRHDFDANLAASFELLEAIRASAAKPRLVNLSSAAVYGDPDAQPMREADPAVPISPYGVSKLAVERYVDVYARLYGLRAASVRLFSVFGPRQRKQVVYDFVRKCRNNPRRMAVFGNGSQTRDFIFVADVVDAILTVADRAPAAGEVYNVASGTSVSLADLVDAVCRSCGVSPIIDYTGAVRPGDAERWLPDCSRLQALGFAARTSLDDGVDAVRTWYDGLVADGSDLAVPVSPGSAHTR